MALRVTLGVTVRVAVRNAIRITVGVTVRVALNIDAHTAPGSLSCKILFEGFLLPIDYLLAPRCLLATY